MLIGRMSILPIHVNGILELLRTNTSSRTGLDQTSGVKRTALIACLAALCIGTNYALLALPNVKLMDAVVFTTGFFFGVTQGTAVAAIAWLVYGTLNPLGISVPVLLAVVPSEAIYALAGGLLRRTATGDPSGKTSVERSIVFGAAGLFSTLAYDLITNAVSGLLSYNSVWMGLLTMNFPIPLGIMHEASNLVFFAVLTPVLLRLLAIGSPRRDATLRR
jgi:hypothetical protein